MRRYLPNTFHCARIPIYKLWRDATRSEAAGTVFLVLFTTIAVLVLVFVQQTASRLVWAFARDRGIAYSSRFARLSSRLKGVPANALLLNALLIFLCGCLFLASTTAFNALLGSFLLLQMVSFAMPAMLLLYQKRNDTLLPPNRSFKVHSAVGWLCNIGTVLAASIETVFFCFPSSRPVTLGNMSKFWTARPRYAHLQC